MPTRYNPHVHVPASWIGRARADDHAARSALTTTAARWLTVCLVGLGGLVGSATAPAQTLESITVYSDLPDHGTHATIRATIEAHPAGEADLPIRVLLRAGETITRAEAWHDDRKVPFTFQSERAPLHQGRVSLRRPSSGVSEEVRDALRAATTIQVEIEVAGALTRSREALTAHLPVPVPGWKPSADATSSFRATIETTVPGTLVESFPTGLFRDTSIEADGASAGRQRFVTSLPVPPAFIQLELARNPGWLRVTWLADGAAIACLLIGMAWAALRLRHASRDRAGSHRASSLPTAPSDRP